MRIAVAKETHSGERRVALVPESAKKLIHAGYEILIEPGTGVAAGWPDEAYRDAGVLLESDRSVVIPSVDIVLTVNLHEPVPAGQNSTVLKRAGAILLGSLMPIRHLQEIKRLAEQRVTAFSSDAIPRSTRAQAMDTLSSMSSIAGYKGALLAAVE